jgi:hypothetical protein
MLKRYDNLFDLESEVLKLKRLGQRQSEESAEKERSFVQRAGAIADLKSIRLRTRAPAEAEPAPKSVRKNAPLRG